MGEETPLSEHLQNRVRGVQRKLAPQTSLGSDHGSIEA